MSRLNSLTWGNGTVQEGWTGFDPKIYDALRWVNIDPNDLGELAGDMVSWKITNIEAVMQELNLSEADRARVEGAMAAIKEMKFIQESNKNSVNSILSPTYTKNVTDFNISKFGPDIVRSDVLDWRMEVLPTTQEMKKMLTKFANERMAVSNSTRAETMEMLPSAKLITLLGICLLLLFISSGCTNDRDADASIWAEVSDIESESTGVENTDNEIPWETGRLKVYTKNAIEGESSLTQNWTALEWEQVNPVVAISWPTWTVKEGVNGTLDVAQNSTAAWLIKKPEWDIEDGDNENEWNSDDIAENMFKWKTSAEIHAIILKSLSDIWVKLELGKEITIVDIESPVKYPDWSIDPELFAEAKNIKISNLIVEWGIDGNNVESNLLKNTINRPSTWDEMLHVRLMNKLAEFKAEKEETQKEAEIKAEKAGVNLEKEGNSDEQEKLIYIYDKQIAAFNALNNTFISLMKKRTLEKKPELEVNAAVIDQIFNTLFSVVYYTHTYWNNVKEMPDALQLPVLAEFNDLFLSLIKVIHWEEKAQEFAAQSKRLYVYRDKENPENDKSYNVSSFSWEMTWFIEGVTWVDTPEDFVDKFTPTVEELAKKDPNVAKLLMDVETKVWGKGFTWYVWQLNKLSTGSQKFVAIAHENLKKEITLDKKKYMKALRDILALVKEEEKLRKADVMGVSETTPLVMSYQDLAWITNEWFVTVAMLENAAALEKTWEDNLDDEIADIDAAHDAEMAVKKQALGILKTIRGAAEAANQVKEAQEVSMR